jgi:2Fe-2S ferredoxin
MPTLTLLPAGTAIDAAPGLTILQALLGAGVAIAHKCEGKAECGACHIFVHEGRKSLSRIQPAENAKLDTLIGIGSKSRLACQTVLGSEPVSVEIPSSI